MFRTQDNRCLNPFLRHLPFLAKEVQDASKHQGASYAKRMRQFLSQ
jgi:hypothetical protein